jgi:hypothetical protein
VRVGEGERTGGRLQLRRPPARLAIEVGKARGWKGGMREPPPVTVGVGTRAAAAWMAVVGIGMGGAVDMLEGHRVDLQGALAASGGG